MFDFLPSLFISILTQGGEGGGFSGTSNTVEHDAGGRPPDSVVGIATSSASIAALSPVSPVAAPFAPSYQSFTPEQLAAAGINMTDFFSQYGNVFNPQGNIADLSSAYSGTPVATGYIDEAGKFVGSPAAGANQAYQLKNLQFPNLSNISGSAPAQGLNELIGQMKNYQPMTAGQRTAYGEEMSGYAPGTAGQFAEQLKGGYQGMEGMSGEERSLMQRQRQNQIDSMREDTRQMMGALAGSGRSIAAFDAMESAAGQIADFGIKSQLAILDNNLAKQKLQYEAIKDQHDFIVSNGLAGSEQYENNMMQVWNQTMTGYAQQINTLATENQQYMDAFSSHADALYKSMMADIGLDQAAMDKSYELFAQANLPQTQEQWDALFAEILKG